MQITPTEIRRLTTKGLRVQWSDGVASEISSETLRTNCPCATCREARGDTSHAKPLTGGTPNKKSMLRVVENSLEQELSLQEVWGVGTYAIGMSWADGHATGIYTYELLLRLARN